MSTINSFKFIDLFAGIGGFHQAMSNLGGECVFASEIDPKAAITYERNYGFNPLSDITQLSAESIPQHDVLCAGFPCQAFSKAGNQKGFEDTRGTLFFDIERILRYHLITYGSPKRIILENVRNLVSHDDGRTWRIIKSSLKNVGYVLTEEPIIVSPHDLGIPQTRDRVVILGIHNSICNLDHLDINIDRKQRNTTDAFSILEKNTSDEYHITEYEEYVLNVWDEFIKGIKEKVIGFPIWSKYFTSIVDVADYPAWKQEFIRKNKALYLNNKDFIDTWLKKHNYLHSFVPTHTKFEWQAGEHMNSVWDGIIQFRPSGIRVKRPTEFPALVAMVHIPIIGWEKRRLTPREAGRLQCFNDDFVPHPSDKIAFKQFGNAVNVKVIMEAFQRLESIAQLCDKDYN